MKTAQHRRVKGGARRAEDCQGVESQALRTSQAAPDRQHKSDAKAVWHARRALVVFSGCTDLWWLRVLRRGYRHCFVLVQSGEDWVLYNPLSNGTEIEVWPGVPEQSLRAWLARSGYEVVDEAVRPLDVRTLPWAPFSCVEAVKRVLGLRAQGVFTPWQLYQYLKKAEKGKKTLTDPD